MRFGAEHGAGLGPNWLYLDRFTGAELARRVPGEGSAGDLFLDAQLPLHSGQLAGLPGRLLVCAAGIAVAMLGLSGVWGGGWRRRGWAARIEA